MGKYYDAESMRSRRQAIEQIVATIDGVEAKVMFGCPCWKVADRMFAFLATDGLTLTTLADDLRDQFATEFAATPIQSGERTIAKWLMAPYLRPGQALGFGWWLRQSAENARTLGPAKKPKRAAKKPTKKPAVAKKKSAKRPQAPRRGEG